MLYRMLHSDPSSGKKVQSSSEPLALDWPLFSPGVSHDRLGKSFPVPVKVGIYLLELRHCLVTMLDMHHLRRFGIGGDHSPLARRL